MIKQFVNVFWKELWARRWAIFGYTLSAILFFWMFAGFYPSIASKSAQFNEVFSSYPKIFFDVLGVKTINMATFDSFVAMELFSMIWPLTALMLIISAAAHAIAGEVEKGTMEIQLSLPMSRIRLYLAKLMSGVTIVFVFVFASVASLIPLAHVYGVGINENSVWIVNWLSLAFCFAVYGAAMAVSSFVSERGQTYMIVGGTLMAMYVINILAGMVKSLEWSQYASIFYYYKPIDVLSNGAALDVWSLTILCSVGAIGAIVGMLRFNKRDILVG